MIKLFDMFAGYGGGSFALKKAGIPFECVGYSEIDKYAIQCYEQNHSGKNFGDCKMINPNELPDFDLLTGGFPCQDVSIAGKRDLGKGRTNLYLEILRIAKTKKPKFMLLENVKGLLSSGKTEKIGRDTLLINKILRDLNGVGYGVCWKVLNSKDFGIPQSRERVWFVCKYGGWDFMEFQFPNPEPLKIFIKDVLEKSVDEKYYLSEKLQERFRKYLKEKQLKEIPMICSPYGGYKNENICGTLGAGCGISASKTNYVINEDKIYRETAFDTGHRNFRESKLSPALSTIGSEMGSNKQLTETKGKLRRLTPKECFRLMGFFDNEIKLDSLSDTQQYKLAGNGWALRPASDILKNMLKGDL